MLTHKELNNMGGDVGLTNHRLLGRQRAKDYDVSWYLEEDETHPTLISIVKVTICGDGIRQTRESYPISVLGNIPTAMNILLHLTSG